ncbi:MAG TPA: N-acetylglucosamine-6-phosphate deacetylase [Steroidobacteraceae bacterium]|jgi:N-acetylglucosamine-6-phosphate deacetylase|nr:N-acetylglucosamine-6-phosphate deacetylase [Steroidobacteraceae bacterium]
MLLAFRNGKLLTESGIETERTLLVRNGRIEAVLAAREVVGADRVVDLRGQLLAPGFIDCQVNGGGGALFNDDPSVETIATIGRAHRAFGTTGFLPTLISDDLDVVEQGIDAVRAAIAAGVPGVLGIHIEGPFLNAEKRGVHDAGKLRALDMGAVKLLSRPHGGVTMVTLAPECTTPELIAALREAGVIVSAGHTNATFAELQPALAAGLRGFTHLFNAMSQLGNREPGAVGAALAHEASWCGLIADGHHVHPETLKLALRAKRHDRFLLVSDAMPSVGACTKNFILNGRPVHVQDGKCVDGNGRLAGADLDMATAVRNTARMLGVPLAQALRMASSYAAEFLALPDVGRLASGQRANLVLLDDALQVRETWIDGIATSP